jgi:hypothetical protein
MGRYRLAIISSTSSSDMKAAASTRRPLGHSWWTKNRLHKGTFHRPYLLASHSTKPWTSVRTQSRPEEEYADTMPFSCTGTFKKSVIVLEPSKAQRRRATSASAGAGEGVVGGSMSVGRGGTARVLSHPS